MAQITKFKGVQRERRGPFILVQGPKPLSNYLLLLLSKSNLTLIKILHYYYYDCSNFWRNAPNAKPIEPLSSEDPN